MLGNGTCILPQLVSFAPVISRYDSDPPTHSHRLTVMCTATTACKYLRVLSVCCSPALKLSIPASHRPEGQVQPNHVMRAI
jgi:hypothetical protein